MQKDPTKEEMTSDGAGGKKSGLSGKKLALVIALCVVLVGGCVTGVVLMNGNRNYARVSVPVSDTNAGSEAAGLTSAGITSGATEGDIAVSGTTTPAALSVSAFIKQGYELKYSFAVNSFSAVSELPVSPAVQYAFSYLYAGDECLVDLSVPTMSYKSATESEIRGELKKLFGSDALSVTQSDLYNSGKKIFEMWQADYQAKVYADARVQAAGTDWKINVTYYTDASKTTQKGSAVLTVRPSGSSYVLAAMAE